MSVLTTPADGGIFKILISEDNGTTWKKLGFRKGLNLGLQVNDREITNADDCLWVASLPTTGSWTINGSCQIIPGDGTTVVSFSDLAKLARTMLDIKIETVDCAGALIANAYRYAGDGYFTQLDAAFTEKDTATYSFSFKGTGALAITKQP